MVLVTQIGQSYTNIASSKDSASDANSDNDAYSNNDANSARYASNASFTKIMLVRQANSDSHANSVCFTK